MKIPKKYFMILAVGLIFLPILGQAYIQWNILAPIPTGRSHFGCETYNGRVYCFGGSLIWSLDSMTTSNEIFYPVTNTWSTAAAMINQRKSFGSTNLNNLFYAIGGIDTTYYWTTTPSILNERYDPVANTWTSLASMPTPRYGCTAAAANGRVYVMGGETGPAGYPNTNANEEYNPGTNTWQIRAPMPESLRYAGAVNFNNLIYVYGGSRNTGIKNEFVYVYNPTTNTWSTASGTMPTPRSTLMPDSLRNFMMTVGGAYGASTETNVAEFYYPGTGTWISETPMNYARYGPGFVRVDSFVYCIGGTYGSGEYPYNYNEGGIYINVALLVDPNQSDSIVPGATRAYTLTVTNQGDRPDVIDITTSGTLPGWTVALYQANNVDTLTDTDADGIKDVGQVPRLGGTRNFVVRITAPAGAPAGQTDVTTVRGTSSIDLNKYDTAVLTTRVRGVVDIIVIPDTSGSTLPAVPVNYRLRAVNNGNLADTVNLSTFHTSLGWTPQLFDSAGTTPITRVAVAAFGGTQKFTLRITPDDTVVAGFRDTTYVRGVSVYNPIKMDTARVITLINGFAGVLLDPDTLGYTGPAVPIIYTLRVQNNGNVNDTFNLTSSGTKPNWSAVIMDTLNNPITWITVPPYGGIRRIHLRVTPPDTVNLGVRDTTTVRGTSRFNGAVFDNARVITEITGFANLLVEPDTSGSTLPGVAVNYNLRAINNGNVPDTVNLSSFHTSTGWIAQILDSTGSAPVTRLPVSPYGGMRRFVLRVTPDDTVLAGFRDTTYVRGISTFNPAVHDSARVITLINGFAGVLLDPDTLAITLPGVPATYTLRVTNNGNVNDTFNLASSGTKPGWAAQILDTLNNPITLILVPPYGGMRRVRVRVTPPDTVNMGVRDTTTVRGTSRFNPAVYDNARLITEIGGFANFLVEPDTTGGTAPGVPVNYPMRVVNNGNVNDTINFSTAHTLPLWIAQILDSTGTTPITRLTVAAWGGIRHFILQIHPPDTVVSGTQDTTYLRGISAFNPAVRDSARVITAIGSFASIIIAPDTTGYTSPGVAVNYTLRAVNSGNVPDTVNLSSFHTTTGWIAQLLDSTGSVPVMRLPLAPYGGTRRFILRVTPRDTVIAGFRDTTYVRGISSYNPAVQDSAQVITIINGFASVLLEPDTLGTTMPGLPVTYTLRIHNNGNVNDTFNLASSGTKPGWTAMIMDTLNNPIPWITVPPYGGLRYLRVRITPPDTVNMGVRDTTLVTGTSRFNPAVSDNARLITEIRGFAAVLIEPDTTGSTLPALPISYLMRAINNGNLADTFNLSTFHTSLGWTAQLMDSAGSGPITRLTVAPYGGIRHFRLRVTPDDTVLAGFRDTTYVRGVSVYNPTVHDSARVITVINGFASLEVLPDTVGSTAPAVPVNYPLRVINNGNVLDTVGFSTLHTLPGWNAQLLDSTGTAPISQLVVTAYGGLRRFILRITPPDTVNMGVRDTTYVKGVSAFNPAVSDSDQVITVIGGFASLLIQPDTIGFTLPGIAVNYPLRAINNGNVADTVNLSALHTTPGWIAQLLDSSGTAPVTRLAISPYGGARRFLLRITPDDTVVAGFRDTTYVRGISTYNPSVSDSAQVITVVNGFAGVLVEPDTLGTTLPGVPVTYRLRVQNNGNVNDTFNLTSAGTKPGWTALITDTLNNPIPWIVVPPYGGVGRIQVRVTPPDTVNAGVIDTTTVTGTSFYNPSISDNARIITQILAVANLTVDPDTAAAINPGDTITYVLRVTNGGNAPERAALTMNSFHPLGWSSQLLDTLGNPVDTVFLAPWGGMGRVWLRVAAPASAGSTDRDSSIVTAQSSVSPPVIDQATVITRIGIYANIIVDPDQQRTGRPGDTLSYILSVDNLGSAVDIIDLSLASTQGWALTPITDTLGIPMPDSNHNGRQDITLAPGIRGWIRVRVRIPNGTPAGTQDRTTVLGQSSNVAGVIDQALLTTTVSQEILAMIVDPDNRQSVPAESTYIYPLYLILSANGPDSVNLAVTPPPTADWKVEIQSQAGQPINRLYALPSDTTRFQLKVTAPAIGISGPIGQIIDSCVSVIAGTSVLNDSVSDIATLITRAVPVLDIHNFASPFHLSHGTSFIMSLPELGKVSISVYNRLGEKVRTVVDGQTFAAGIHVVPWDGRDTKDKLIVPGVYLYVFDFNGATVKETIKKKTAVYAH